MPVKHTHHTPQSGAGAHLVGGNTHFGFTLSMSQYRPASNFCSLSFTMATGASSSCEENSEYKQGMKDKVVGR